MRFFLGYNERQAMLSAENEFPRRRMKIAENRKEFHMITLERTSVMNLENAIRILTESEADCYLFCGDGIRDAESAADLLDKLLQIGRAHV